MVERRPLCLFCGLLVPVDLLEFSRVVHTFRCGGAGPDTALLVSNRMQ